MVNSTMEHFYSEGYLKFGVTYKNEDCIKVSNYVKNKRPITSQLFLDESAYLENPVHKGVNPEPGRNLIEKVDLDFIESSDFFQKTFTEILGENFEILNKKFVVGVPEEIIPDWILKKTNDELVPNLGPYIKPELRDITYFHGIDFHQDLIDYKNKEPNFLTYYVYLESTNAKTSPLNLIPKSHTLGASKFPHELDVEGEKLVYTNLGNRVESKKITLTGEPGISYFWHALLLHGTQPQKKSIPRISLRYILQPKGGDCTGTLIRKFNDKLGVAGGIDKTRDDLDAKGKATLKGNVINKIKLED